VLGATRLRGFMLRGYRRSHRLRPLASAVLSSSHLRLIYLASPKGERYFNSCNLLILVRWLSARTPHRKSAYRAAPGSLRDAHVGRERLGVQVAVLPRREPEVGRKLGNERHDVLCLILCHNCL
jgi:hypothetical protein